MNALAKLIVALLLVAIGSAHAQDRRDGNWWRAKDRSTQIAYVLGTFDGTILGYGFTTWKLTHDKSAADALGRANEANREYAERYMSKVSAAQVADGLDVFYADFRNRSILTFGATWLVLAQIAGDPDIDQMIDSWRKNASRY